MPNINKYNIVIAWYQNDWGLFGRRNEMLTKALINHPQVNKVLHLEPPMNLISVLRRLFWFIEEPNQVSWKHFIMNIKRIFFPLINIHSKLITLTPFMPIPQKIYNIDNAYKLNKKFILWELKKVLRISKINKPLLWLYPFHPFINFLIENLESQKICLDVVDKNTEDPDIEYQKSWINNNYIKTIQKADIIFTVSKSLCDEIKQFHNNTHWIPNGIEQSFIDSSNHIKIPDSIRNLKNPNIGYVGSIYHRLDLNLLSEVIKQNPQWNFIFIGHVRREFKRTWKQFISKFKNIYYLGSKNYSEIASYIYFCDVCIIPHKINKLSDSMDPLKLYLYLAKGKPIVSTNISRARNFKDDIIIANDINGFSNSIKLALIKNSATQIKKRINKVKNYTWENKINEIIRLIENN